MGVSNRRNLHTKYKQNLKHDIFAVSGKVMHNADDVGQKNNNINVENEKLPIGFRKKIVNYIGDNLLGLHLKYFSGSGEKDVGNNFSLHKYCNGLEKKECQSHSGCIFQYGESSST